MDNTEKDILIRWLNNAYAMEESIVETLERQVDQLDEMSEVKEKVQEHIEITKNQADKVKKCIERLGGDVSQIKSAGANIMGAIQGMSTAIADDKMVKDALAIFATEHFEIASYLSLITAAEELGDEETAKVCEGILHEEEEMAEWVKKQLPLITKKYLASE